METARRGMITGAIGGLAATAFARISRAATGLALGEMELLTLSDGDLAQPAGFIFGRMPREAPAPYLAGRGIDRAAPLALVCREERVDLFDAGSGTGFVDTAGELPGELSDALAAAGVDPLKVTHVVFTHGHAHSLWGVLDDFDEPFFANARHLMGRVEFDCWMGPHAVNTASAERVSMAVDAKRRVEVTAEPMSLFEDGGEILPGITARGGLGHLPGHMSFELRDGSESLMVVGDALLTPHTAFAHPDWEVGADNGRAAAAKMRAGLLALLAAMQKTMIGFHLPGGGLGRAERQEGGFRFVPA